VFSSVFLGAIFAFLTFIPQVFTLGNRSLKKHPMSLKIDACDYIRGTTGNEFGFVDIKTSSISKDSDAYNLISSTSDLGRKPFEFEARLIEKMVSTKPK